MNSRFAIVGCEASGKTVLTASLADFFQPGESRVSCSMVPENVAAHRFFEYTQHQMRMKHAWPQATNPDKTAVLKWSLRIDGNIVAELDMLDFGGEVFRSAFREGEPTESGVAAQKELLEYLSASDFIVVTVSLGVLTRDMESAQGISASDFASDAEEKWVTRGLLDFVRRRLPPETGVVIALTQADLHRRELEECGGAEGLFKKSWPTVAALYPDIPVVAVAAVSGVAEDGTPQEGYTSDGVVPLMKAFADFCVGGVDDVRKSIAATLDRILDAPGNTDPRIFRKYITEYSDDVQLFRIASGLTGDCFDDELKQYVAALVNSEGEIANKLKRLEDTAFAKYTAQEERRMKAEAETRAAEEAKRRMAEQDAEKRRAEEAKRAEDERVKSEKELEKRKLEARIANRRSMARIFMSLAVVLVAASVCGLCYLIDRSRRAAAVESLRVEEIRKAALVEQVHRFAEAAQNGDVAAAQHVLDMLEKDEISESDVIGLYRIYMLLVNKGDARAMFRLGVACHEGTCGLKRSDFNAHWFLSMAKNSGYESPRLDELIAITASVDDNESQSRGIDLLFSAENDPATDTAATDVDDADTAGENEGDMNDD